ncbi:MAG TPA: hypothetical protein VEK08_24445 [Planctomycetota bacterium]|nr:hypothetical protein [Planctomycetota bacterium]
MTPGEFKNFLGPWSSHPDWLRQKEERFRAWGFALIVALLLFGVVLFKNFSWMASLRAAWSCVFVLGIAANCALCCITTVAVCRLMAEYYSRNPGKNEYASARTPVRWELLFVCLAAGAIGPFFLSRMEKLPPEIRYAFHLFAIFPLTAVFASLGRYKNRPGERARTRPVSTFIFVALLCATIYSVFHDLQDSARQIVEREWIERHMLGLLILTPLTVAAYAAMALFPLYEKIPVEEDSSREREQRAETSKPPEWVAGLLRNLPGGTASRIEPLVEGDTSPVTAREDLRMLFGGVLPTKAQVHLFERFRDSHHELIDKFGAGNNEHLSQSSDLLIDGPIGSGRTTALLACAAYAAFVRGQRVLIVVPDETRQNLAVERIRNFLERARLHYYVSCDVVREDKVNTWLQDGAQVPSIFVGTLLSVEHYLYGARCSAADEPRLRRLILGIEVIIVDDFMDYSDTQRSHIPFLLDKQRLLLDAEFMPLQVLVVFPRLAELAKAILGERFFTAKRFKTENTVTLLPLPGERDDGRRGWHVTIESADPKRILDELAVNCLKLDANPYVIVYEKGLGEEQCQKREKVLKERSQKNSLAVISDLNQQIENAPSVDAVFYQVAVHEERCLALRLYMGHSETVIFSILKKGEILQPGRVDSADGVLPVVTHRSARPLMLEHLRSIIRFLRPKTPLFEDMWNQLGLKFPELQERVREGSPDLVIDRDMLDEESYRRRLLNFISLRETRSGHEPVMVGGVPDESRDFFRHIDGRSYFIAAAHAKAPERERNRRLIWHDDAGQLLHEEDLAHLREFRLVRGRNAYVPQHLEATADGVVATTQPWLGGGDDEYLPVYDAAWSLPHTARAVEHQGGRQRGVSWFQLQFSERPLIKLKLTHLMNDFGGHSSRDQIEVHYRARFSCIVINPEEFPSEELSEELGAWMSGDWETNPDSSFWPELTAAMNYAFESRLPGLLYYARIFAFKLKPQHKSVGEAVIWLIEPNSSGDTVMSVVGEVMRKTEERKALFKTVNVLLEKLKQSESPQALMRRMGRVGYDGDGAMLDCNLAVGIIDSILKSGEGEREQLPPPVRRQPVPRTPQISTRDHLPAEASVFVRPSETQEISALWAEALPVPPRCGQGQLFRWEHKERKYELKWGFSSEAQQKKYLEKLNNFKTRIHTEPQLCFTNYVRNDPYVDSVRELGEKLLEAYGRRPDEHFPGFALSFIQSIPYIRDPKRPTDWPRFPSEFYANYGGDCEDSSIAYMALLTQFGYDAGYILMDGHVAVGVAGPYQGFAYDSFGKRYYYAETAIDGGYLPLGEKGDQARPGRVLANPLRQFPTPSLIQILNAECSEDCASLLVTLVSQAPETDITIAVYARKASDIMNFDAKTTCVSSARLPGARTPLQVVDLELSLNHEDLSPGSYFVDVIAFTPKGFGGGWTGASQFTLSKIKVTI